MTFRNADNAMNSADPEIYFPAKIKRAAARMDKLVKAFARDVYGKDNHLEREHWAADFLADFAHWCKVNRYDFNNELRIARGHFEAETRHEF